MNILLDRLPEEVTVDGAVVPIYADHRSCIRAHMALTDVECSPDESLRCFYPVIPRSRNAALRAELEFLCCDLEPPLPSSLAEGSTAGRIWSFLYDQEAILAAFYSQYHIDLTTETLHWWVFRVLLKHLRGNHMADRMHARGAKETADMGDAERKTLRREKQRWRLPAMAQEQRMDDELAKALQAGDMERVNALLGRKE